MKKISKKKMKRIFSKKKIQKDEKISKKKKGLKKN